MEQRYLWCSSGDEGVDEPTAYDMNVDDDTDDAVTAAAAADDDDDNTDCDGAAAVCTDDVMTTDDDVINDERRDVGSLTPPNGHVSLGHVSPSPTCRQPAALRHQHASGLPPASSTSACTRTSPSPDP